MYCNNCGKEIDNEWKVCPYCGARNENVLSESTPQPTPQVNYGQPTPQAPYGQPVPQPSYNQQYGQPLDFNRDFINTAQPKPKKKSKLPIIITAVVLVVAIVLGAIFIPGLLKSKGEEGEDGNKTVKMMVFKAFTYNENGESEKSEISYDQNGKMTTSKTYVNGQCVEEEIFTFNSDGRILKEVVYRDGVLDMEIDMQYDSNGKVTEIVYHDENGEESYRYEYGRDGKGNKITEKYYYYGELRNDFSYKYSYDSQGRMTKCEQINLTVDNPKVTEYYYNDAGQKSEEIVYLNGYLYTATTRTFDAAGNCLTETCSGPDDFYSVLTRIYDEKGNIISYDFDGYGYDYYDYTFEYVEIEVLESDAEAIRNQQNLIAEKFVVL